MPAGVAAGAHQPLGALRVALEAGVAEGGPAALRLRGAELRVLLGQVVDREAVARCQDWRPVTALWLSNFSLPNTFP